MVMNRLFLFPALACVAQAVDLPISVDPAGTFTGTFAVEWNTTGNFESWSAVNATATVSGGSFNGTATTTDSRVQRTAIASGPDLDLGYNDFIELRVQVPASYTGAIQIFYGTTMTTGFASDRVITIPAATVPDDGAFHTYRIDAGLEPYWRSTLRELRVDAVDGTGSAGMNFAIDYVRIGDAPGATVYQPRHTTECPAAGGTTPAGALLGPGQTVQSMESKHFRFLWNSGVAANGPWTATMARNTLRNAEEAWQVFVKQLGYREPSRDWVTQAGTQYKLNITSWHSGYWAGGDDSGGAVLARLNITPDGLRENPPTWVIPHELMHCFQMHNSTPSVPGSWYECHANYGRERWLQSYGVLFPAEQRSGIDPTSLRCAHQIVGHGRDYYLTWPLFLYLDENPDGLSDLGEGTVVDLWQQPLAGEYPLMTLERLTPASSLKTIVGGYARRGATYNYKTKADIQAALAAFGQPLDNAATDRWRFTDLVQRADSPSWWQVPYEMAPMQGAFAIHELVPAGSGDGRVVTVNFQGLADSARGADWSASFIVIADDGSERYSTLWSSGNNSVTLAANENKLYLSVAGAPATFHDSAFSDVEAPYRSHPGKARFPYQLQVTGAMPKQRDNGGTSGLVQHANGGGYKTVSANVAATAYLGPNARVLDTAQVLGNARIEDYAVVSGGAQVSGNAIVSGHALVRGNAVVNGDAKVRDWALVEGGTVSLKARVLEHGNIKGGTVTDLATAKGTAASISGTLSGNAIIDGDYGDFWYGRDIANGIAFGHEPYVGTPDSSIRALPAGLYVSYDFASAHDSRILDQYGVTDGYTIGSPGWTAADAKRKGFLSFDGATQAVALPRSVADLRDFSFTAWVKPLGGAANQAVLWLGASPTKRLSFTPDNGLGQAKFAIVNGGAEQSLTAAALTPNVWTHVAITLNGSTGTLYVNGVSAASGAITIRADQVLAANTATALQHNYLARSEGSLMNSFRGSLDDVRFYATALGAAEVTALQPPGSAATAGTLHVDLRASDASAGTATWSNNGSLGNFTRTGTASKVANVNGTNLPGVLFNGSSDAYTGPNTTTDLHGASNRTIEVWAYNPSLVDEETTVSWGHRWSDRQNMAFNFGSHPDWGATTHWADDLGWGTPPSANAWHHLVYTYDGGTVAKVYIDGVLASSKTLGAALNTFASEPVNIGCQREAANGTRSLFYGGYLNAVRIHGGVLSDTQIAANFNFGPSGAANAAPTLDSIADQALQSGVASPPISLTLGDADTPSSVLTLSGSAANAALIPPQNIVFSGSGTSRTVTITPVAAGTTTVTIVVGDGAATASRTFNVTIDGGGGGGLQVAGTLHVDLRASDASAGSATWLNNGTLGSFASTGGPAKVADVAGTGLPGVQFDGIDDAYTGPNSVADLDGGSNRTIEVWAYNPSLLDEETTVSWGHRGSVRQDMAFNFGSNATWGAATHWDDDAGWGTPPGANAWRHLVYTYDGGTTVKLYIDGVLATTRTLAGALNTFASEPVNLGCQRESANGSRSLLYSGYLNTVRIHGGVLSDAQVAANFTYGPTAGTPPPAFAPYVVDADTLHLWHLDSTTAPAADSVTTNNLPLQGLLGGAMLPGSNSVNGLGGALLANTGANTGGILLAASALANGSGDNVTFTHAHTTSGAFTYEAVIKFDSGYDPLAQPSSARLMDIVSMDGDGNAGTRVFQFLYSGRTATAAPKLQFINQRSSAQTLSADVPISGSDAVNNSDWFHVAITYNGSANTAGNLKFYWTKLTASTTAAAQIGGSSLNMSQDLQAVAADFALGNEARNTGGASEGFAGTLDEVRISRIVRAATAMMPNQHDSNGDGAPDSPQGLVNPDIDGDTLPDDWEALYYDPADAGAGEDLDGDGQTNGDEFIAGTAPTDGQDAARLRIVSVDPTVLEFDGRIGRSYTLQRLADAEEATWQNLEVRGPLLADGPIQLSDDATPSKRAIYRLKIQLLQP
jgi:hypothetical protein